MPTANANDAKTEPERLVLDTSAVMAYFADEPGAIDVEQMLRKAQSGRAEIRASFITFMEVLYTVWQKLGENAGKAAYLRLMALPVKRVGESDEILMEAARLKVGHAISLGDAWIVATAVTTKSTLVHRDPEFRALAESAKMLELPPKAKIKS